MDSEVYYVVSPYLIHYGTKGQKWGERRYQNRDGTWTLEGKIRRRVGGVQKRLSNATSSLSRSYNNKKIDTLDYLNRKGVLDFLDSQADKPFSSIREASPDTIKKAEDFVKDYRSAAYEDLSTGMRKVARYSSMVTAMRKNEPYVKVEDTSKPWMETFKNGMMGWNHVSDIEDDVSTKAGRKFAEAVVNGKLSDADSYNLSKLLNYDRPDLIGGTINGRRDMFRYYSKRDFTESDHEDVKKEALRKQITSGINRSAWDRPMDITTADGMKVNSVIYANGGGVQGRTPGTATTRRRDALAKEVADTIARTGRVPMVTISSNYRNVPNNVDNFVRFYDAAIVDWIKEGPYERGWA